jgi:hypothetical protein
MAKSFDHVESSGSETQFDTGSQRDARDGKGRFDLIPPYALHRLAKHFENGARRYQDRNWEKGQPLSVYLDSAIRHTNKALMGLNDEDHYIAATWNLLCLVETKKRIELGILPKELDNLPDTYKDHDPDPKRQNYILDSAAVDKSHK